MSEQVTCHKTYKEKLRPTPAQERALERFVVLSRALQHRLGASHHRLAALPRLALTLSAGGRAEGHPHGVP
jgi:hypothetical protein